MYARKKFAEFVAFAASPIVCQTADSGMASETMALPFESWVVMYLLMSGRPFCKVFASADAISRGKGGLSAEA